MPPSPPTDYELYLRVPELLSLQKPPEALSCHDELQFQIVHQAAELWMKLIDHECSHLCALLDEGELMRATVTLRRVHQIERLLLEGLEVLYTMSPRDYMRIRAVLGRGSGQESPGFRRMLAMGGDIWPHVEALLQRRGVALRAIYEVPEAHPELFALMEALTDVDLRLQEWRNRHILLVYRTIGMGTPSLKGKHSELLERGLRTQFFPRLWEVRDELYSLWSEQHKSGAPLSLSAQAPPPGTP